MTAPAGTPPAGAIAWNSFGFASSRGDTGGELLPAEPRKVGIEVRPAPNGLLRRLRLVRLRPRRHPGPGGDRAPSSSISPSVRPGSTACVFSSTRTSATTARPPMTASSGSPTPKTPSTASPASTTSPSSTPASTTPSSTSPTGSTLTLQDADGDGGAIDDTDSEVDSDAAESPLTFEGDVITAVPNPGQVVVPTTPSRAGRAGPELGRRLLEHAICSGPRWATSSSTTTTSAATRPHRRRASKAPPSTCGGSAKTVSRTTPAATTSCSRPRPPLPTAPTSSTGWSGVRTTTSSSSLRRAPWRRSSTSTPTPTTPSTRTPTVSPVSPS